VEPEAFKEYITDRYEDQINWYEMKASSNKRYYQIFQWVVIILSAVTPALVVLSSPDILSTQNIFRPWIWGAAIVVSTLLAIGTAGVKTFKFQENWTNYRATAERLIQEKIFYDANVGDYGHVESKQTLFVERVEALLSGENAKWSEVQKEKSSESS